MNNIWCTFSTIHFSIIIRKEKQQVADGYKKANCGSVSQVHNRPDTEAVVHWAGLGGPSLSEWWFHSLVVIEVETVLLELRGETCQTEAKAKIKQTIPMFYPHFYYMDLCMWVCELIFKCYFPFSTKNMSSFISPILTAGLDWTKVPFSFHRGSI